MSGIRKVFVKRAIILLIIYLSVVAVGLYYKKVKAAKPLATPATKGLLNCSCIANRDHFYQSNYIFSERKANSTCSDEGTFYHPMQKVVSMSFYLKDPSNTKLHDGYLECLIRNLKRMKKLYPGTSLRLYTDVNLTNEFCDVYCKNPELFWCDIRKSPSLGDQSGMFGMTWRFLPLGDPTVDYFMVRDLDAVIRERQVAVFKEWMKTTKPIHLMRDHVQHRTPMLGGMWGARNYLLGLNESKQIRDKIIKLAKESRYQGKGADQVILNKVVYYPMQKQILAFDSYHCRNFGETDVVPFPTKRKNSRTDFVGNPYMGLYNLEKCPIGQSMGKIGNIAEELKYYIIRFC